MWHFVWRELYEPSISTVTCILPLAETSLPKQAGIFTFQVCLEMLRTSFDADMVWCHHQMLQWNQVLLAVFNSWPLKIYPLQNGSHGSANGCVWKVATVEGSHSSLPWLWEGYVKLLGSKNYWAENLLMTHAVPGHREAVCFIEAFPRLKDLNVFKDSQPSLDDMVKPLRCYYPPVKPT